MNDSTVFYVKAKDDKVLFLDGDPASHDLSQRIDLKNYIQADGYELRGENQFTGLPPNQRDLCERLVLAVEQWQGAIGQLNHLARTARDRSAIDLQLKAALK